MAATLTSAAKVDAAVGVRIKALRDAMGLSLRELAERSGVSAPMLSQVERGETSPTIALATKIASGLELSLSQLLRLDESRHIVIVRSGDGAVRSRHGHSVTELSAPLPGQRAAVSRHELAPGASTGGVGDPPIHEPGSRETAVVLGGTVTLVVDGERYELYAGDSVTFDADISHHFENNETEPAELLAVVAAGLRRG